MKKYRTFNIKSLAERLTEKRIKDEGVSEEHFNEFFDEYVELLLHF